MADREWYPDGGTNGHRRVRVYFSFNTNAASAPDTSLIKGAGDMVDTITRSNVGEYTVTLSARDHYPLVIGARATLEDSATGDGGHAEIGYFQNEGTASALKFRVFTYDNTDAPANVTNSRVFCELVLRNTNASGVP